MMERLQFEDWYVRAHPRLVSSLTVVSGDAGLAADATDEAFVRAYERWDHISRMGSPDGWTFKTALNVLRRRQRRASIERRLLGRAMAGDRQRGARPADWSVEVWDALRRLPDRERTAVALRYVADLPTQAIAEAMGIARGTVGSTLHSARASLARTLCTSAGGDAVPGSATPPGGHRQSPVAGTAKQESPDA